MKSKHKKPGHLKIFLRNILIICAAAVCYTLLNVDVFFKPAPRFSVNWQMPAAVCPAGGGIYALDKAGTNIVHVMRNGIIKKQIKIINSESFSQAKEIAADGNGNAYVYIQKLYPDSQLTQSDSIVKINLQSKKTEQIYSEEYAPAASNQPRAYAQYNSLYYKDGLLKFSKTEKEWTRLFVYNTHTGELKHDRYILEPNVPFYTQKVYVKDLQNFYYLARSGNVYQVENAGMNVASPLLITSFSWLNQNDFFLLAAGLDDKDAPSAGITGGIPWLKENGNTAVFPREMRYSTPEIIRMITAYITLISAIALFIVYLYYYIYYIKHRYISLYIYQLVLIIPLSAVIFLLLYNIIYKPFEAREKTRLVNELLSYGVHAQACVNVAEIELINDVHDYETHAYSQIYAGLRRAVMDNTGDWNKNRRAGVYKLVESGHWGRYQRDETRAMLYCIALSNGAEGLFMLAGTINSTDYAALAAGKPVTGIREDSGGSMAYALFPLFNSTGGLTSVFETAADMRGIKAAAAREKRVIFESMSVAVLSIALLMMLTLSNITISIQKLVSVMKTIQNGNYKARARYAGNNELGELFHNFNFIAAALERHVNAESSRAAEHSFFAMLSHEIRTPLNAVLGLANIELQNQSLPEETKNNIYKIYSSSRTLLNLTNDVLDTSKMEAGKFEIIESEYNVSEMISQAVEVNKVRIKNKPVEFKVEIDPALPAELYGDDTRILQILNNLLSNAIKYTQKGSILFSVFWQNKKIKLKELLGIETDSKIELNSEGMLILTVKDTGTGIKPEDHDKIFEKYIQTDLQKNQHIEGTGLGLAITRQLVELMRGTITLESVYGQGSSFQAVIPQRICGSEKIGTETALRISSFKYTPNTQKHLQTKLMPYARVLVVDDVETNLDVARGLLEQYNINVDCVNNGHEAIELVKKSDSGSIPKYDAVFIDHLMDGIDGIETMRAIRAALNSVYGRALPIIIMTGSAKNEFSGMFNENGFTGYLSKPVDPSELYDILKIHVQKENFNSAHESDSKEYRKEEPKQQSAGSALIRINEGLEDVDISKGISYFEGLKRYLPVIESFTVNIPPLLIMLGALKQNMEYGTEYDFNSFRINAHGIKGAARNIFADKLAKRAAELEKKAKAGNKEYIIAHTNSFVEQACILIDALGLFIQENSEHSRPVKDYIPEDMLEKLARACEEYDIPAIDTVMEELKKYDYIYDGSLAGYLIEKTANSDFSEIAERLRSKRSLSA
ncbi:MAG: response regulator [Spirochaetaceae bacterium]|jgi:signal transduction histidine kinase/CheY-like chemotaxis protein/HPt (histidine-containing phosphotransfer) domain-containing protein|nr:response regulator [Spirochaetaceae bacterium]